MLENLVLNALITLQIGEFYPKLVYGTSSTNFQVLEKQGGIRKFNLAKMLKEPIILLYF